MNFSDSLSRHGIGEDRTLVGRNSEKLRQKREASKHCFHDQCAVVAIQELAIALPARAWRRVTWREGSNTTLSSRFAAVRVRPAHRDYNRTMPRPEEWCLIEWPKGGAEPTKYWLSTLPARMSRRVLVDITNSRRRIERDYQDLKQELGLDIMKDDVGEFSIITRHSVSPLMGS
jgi:SRSO17 transposase